MEIGLAIFLGIIVIGGLATLMYGVALYNRLIAIKVNCDKAWSNIDVLEKQRYDEIPNLVRVCEGYMQHERETLEKVIAARTSYLAAGNPAQVAAADNMLAGALKTLFAVAENYPNLKANENFGHLQGRISELENQIADRREFYNEAVTIFNARIQQIPDVFVAGILGYRQKEMYKAPPEEKVVPRVSFGQPR
jgi:LemA protein